MMKDNPEPFWKIKSLDEMTINEWESLCDGCGRCCLEKLEDQDTGEVEYTHVSCRWLDTVECRCAVYNQRFKSAPDCIVITPENVKDLRWLPDTCAYRLVAEGRALQQWHHLISGDAETVHLAGISVRNKVVPGQYVHPDDLEGYII